MVHFLQKDVDILTLPENAILVCTTAAPKWAVVLNKCAGLITEQGSVAGHLANVAREFGVPALFGVSEAMSRFTAGQEITLMPTIRPCMRDDRRSAGEKTRNGPI